MVGGCFLSVKEMGLSKLERKLGLQWRKPEREREKQ